MQSKVKKGKGGRPPLVSKAAGGSGGMGPSGPSSAAALNAAVATQQEHLQDAESNQVRSEHGMCCAWDANMGGKLQR